jgi:hypothetical protein
MPDVSNVAWDVSGITSETSDVTPDVSNATPEESGAALEMSGVLLEASGVTLDASGFTLERSGATFSWGEPSLATSAALLQEAEQPGDPPLDCLPGGGSGCPETAYGAWLSATILA